jgi:hypothetical protein
MKLRQLRNILLKTRNDLGRCANLCDALIKDIDNNLANNQDRQVKALENRAVQLFQSVKKTLKLIGVSDG